MLAPTRGRRAGDDTYVVDDTGDVVDENISGSDGIHTVQSLLHLCARRERGEPHAGGQQRHQRHRRNSLTGNTGANVLDGRAGIETADYGDKSTSVVVTLNAPATPR